ncbi:hypothetical protein RJ640_006167 [Escallonia rubra]|uniref:Uncharacterized protein n=1 Tax=Escallonia rubra TaxID=112253 RepID=A0AA88S4A2_9ASTE|nr:hypothetical protein RJ640_006167 [Escallonia rubra]
MGGPYCVELLFGRLVMAMMDIQFRPRVDYMLNACDDQRPLFGMNMQQVIQPRASANGFGRRKVERESGSKMDNKSQTGKTNSSRLTTAGDNC